MKASTCVTSSSFFYYYLFYLFISLNIFSGEEKKNTERKAPK